MILVYDHINDYKIAGRLGNQMFIVASIMGLAKTYHREYDFGIAGWNYADRFGFVMNNATNHNIPHVSLTWYSTFGYDKKLVEYIASQHNNHMILTVPGYLQHYRYFHHHNDYILDLFNPNPKQIKHNTCSIHVRRGDYVNLSRHHPCCSMEYYREAIKLIQAKHGQHVTFRIYSDDIGWCKQNFKGDEYEFSENNDEVEDLLEMATCEHNIIANSSYSWWGAYLNRNKNKIIIKPKKWFGSALNNLDASGFNIKGWIEL